MPAKLLRWRFCRPKDLLDPDIQQRKLSDFLQPAFFVTPSQPIEELLPLLQDRKDHMGIVVDEFGSAIGLITVEDILEEVVGDIDDVDMRFYNHRKHHVTKIGKGSFIADGGLPISDLNDLLNLKIPTREFRSLSGLLASKLRHIPGKDESIVEAGYRFTVVESDQTAAKSVRIEPLAVSRS